MPLGSLLAGALADLVGGPWVVTAMGASCILFAVGVALFVPNIWKLNLAPGYQVPAPEVDGTTREQS